MNWYKQQINKFAKRQWSQKELDSMKNMLLEGKSLSHVGRVMGTNPSAISYLNKKYKWKQMGNKYRPKEYPQERLETIKKLVLEGKTFQLVGELTGLSLWQIGDLNKKYKWRTAPGRTNEERLKKWKMVPELYLLPPEGKGLSAQEIAKILHMRDTNVIAALKYLGLSHKIRTHLESVRTDRHVENRKNWWIDNPEEVERQSDYKKNWWQNYPGGFNAWIQTFPEEKQKEILQTIHTVNS